MHEASAAYLNRLHQCSTLQRMVKLQFTINVKDLCCGNRVTVTTLCVPAGEFSLGSTIVGTYGYMAPEQFTGMASPASDLYALGATLLFLVSGLGPGQFPQQRMRIAWR